MSVVCCRVEVSVTGWSIVQWSPAECVCHCVWYRNLMNEEAMSRVVPRRGQKKKKLLRERVSEGHGHKYKWNTHWDRNITCSGWNRKYIVTLRCTRDLARRSMHLWQLSWWGSPPILRSKFYVTTPSLHCVTYGSMRMHSVYVKKSCYENKIRKQETLKLTILRISESADDTACSKWHIKSNRSLVTKW